MELDFFISGKSVPPPINYRELQIEMLFTADKPSASVSATSLEWVGYDAIKINNYIRQGLFGQAGIYEGLPVQIRACNSTFIVFDGMIDLASASALFECDKVIAPIRRTGDIDFVNDRAESISFAYLASITPGLSGYISKSDYLAVPYTVTTHRTSFEKISIILSTYVIVKEFLETIKRTKELINTIIADIAGIATATSTAYAILKVAAMVLNILLFIAYLIVLITSLINMVVQLIDLIYPIKRYKLAMKVATLLQRGFAYLGMSFSSTIFQAGATYENFIYMPRKNTIPDTSSPLNVFKRGANELNNPNAYGYPDMTFKQFIIEMQDYFNASIKIINNVAHFEVVDYWNNKSNQINIPSIGKVGYTFNYPDPHGTNASELPSNYLLIYALDGEDINTYQRYAGTSYQVQLTPKVINYKQNVLLKNLKEVRLGVSLVKRKDYMNELEQDINIVIGTLVTFINSAAASIKKLINKIKKGFRAPL